MVIRQTIKIDVCLAKTSFKTRLSGQCIVTNNEILEPGEPQLGLILSVERLFSPKIQKTAKYSPAWNSETTASMKKRQ